MLSDYCWELKRDTTPASKSKGHKHFFDKEK